MKLLGQIIVPHQGQDRSVMLFVGDISQLPQDEAVDLLVVSAFPNDYLPTRTSVIGALHRRGVSVEELARDKEVDLRAFSSCWLSRPINRPDIAFRRILCFEPPEQGSVAEVVGDIFRSIFPFTTRTSPISQIALPVIAAGARKEPPEKMLEVLADTAVHWLSIGLPVDRIKIVVSESVDVQAQQEVFRQVKQRFAYLAPPSPSFEFDVFVSYCHKNKDEVDCLVDTLRTERPSLRLFLDRLELNPGAAWQQKIFEALDASRKVVCVYSPDYLQSKVCLEEFNIALLRQRKSSDNLLLPIYLRSANLPTYMELFQYHDAREGDEMKIRQAAKVLLGHI